MPAIKIYKTSRGIVINHGDDFFLSKESDWDTFVNRNDLFKKVTDDLKSLKASGDLSAVTVNNLAAPIGGQEIWAAGVTYVRSREARMEESKDAGGGDFYAKVYEADRPELFFKATAYRTVGSGEVVRIRKDSQWNVPEPELTLFIARRARLKAIRSVMICHQGILKAKIPFIFHRRNHTMGLQQLVLVYTFLVNPFILIQ